MTLKLLLQVISYMKFAVSNIEYMNLIGKFVICLAKSLQAKSGENSFLNLSRHLQHKVTC